MKKLNVLVLFALLMSSFSAMAMRIDMNGGEVSLPSCGGTIEAKGGIFQAAAHGSDSNQINLIVRDSEYCSNFIIETTGKVYKFEGRPGTYHGSYSITADKLDMGWNQIDLIVRSNNEGPFAHRDRVSVWVNVVPGHSGGYHDGAGSNYVCANEAEEAAKAQYREDFHAKVYSVNAIFDRKSEKGNYVYNVRVDGRSGPVRYETVMRRRDCSLASDPVRQ